jgi:hypothetical protein
MLYQFMAKKIAKFRDVALRGGVCRGKTHNITSGCLADSRVKHHHWLRTFQPRCIDLILHRIG